MNIAMLNGNLTRDPELKSTQNGKQVCSFSIAINEGKDKTEFVNCVAWEKTAELIGQVAKKGDRMCVSGRIQTRKWTDQQGQDRYATEVIVNQFDFPPKRSDQPAQQAQGSAFEDDIPF